MSQVIYKESELWKSTEQTKKMVSTLLKRNGQQCQLILRKESFQLLPFGNFNGIQKTRKYQHYSSNNLRYQMLHNLNYLLFTVAQ